MSTHTPNGLLNITSLLSRRVLLENHFHLPFIGCCSRPLQWLGKTKVFHKYPRFSWWITSKMASPRWFYSWRWPKYQVIRFHLGKFGFFIDDILMISWPSSWEVVVLATMVPGVLFCMAPGPYREDGLPSWDSWRKGGKIGIFWDLTDWGHLQILSL